MDLERSLESPEVERSRNTSSDTVSLPPTRDLKNTRSQSLNNRLTLHERLATRVPRRSMSRSIYLGLVRVDNLIDLLHR
jgi:hypothetical protein